MSAWSAPGATPEFIGVCQSQAPICIFRIKTANVAKPHIIKYDFKVQGSDFSERAVQDCIGRTGLHHHAIDAMFKQMKADGVDVIGFGAGEPDFNTPDNIKAAGIAAIEQNVTRYTPAAGTVELRQAVCGRMKADYGLEYKPSQVVVSSGAKHLVYLALRAVVNPGDEVILPAPTG